MGKMALLAAIVLLTAGCAGRTPSSPPADANVATDSIVNAPIDDVLAKVGRWIEPEDATLAAIHTVLLPDGRLVYWAGLHAHGPAGLIADGPGRAQTRVLTFNGSTFSVMTPADEAGGGDDMFCAGQVLLPDGTVLVAGGSVATGPRGLWYGSQDGRIFDPRTNAWTQVGKMDIGRWYPGVLTLPDGQALVASGTEVDMKPDSMVNRFEVYDPAVRDFHQLPPSADRDLPMYPRLFVVPSGPLAGDVFFQPAGCLWCPGGAEPDEVGWNFAASLDLGTNAWTQYDTSVLGARQNPVTVLLPLRGPDYDARIFTAAGTLNRMSVATNTAEITDLSGARPTHTLATPLLEGRWFAQHVLLPDGQILIVGGSKTDGVMLLNSDSEIPHQEPMPAPPVRNDATPVLVAELYDPEGVGRDDLGRVTEGASAIVGQLVKPRVYHATAMLLPDGRVFIGGSAPPFGEIDLSFEIYEPPYLFRGDRPVIDEVPAHVGYGEELIIRTADATRVSEVLLAKPGAVTHVYNPDQRLVELEILGRDAGTLTVKSPPNANIGLPGHWMLFLRTETDLGPVISEAKFMHLGPTLP